jgi:hypothetical protein
MNLSFITLTYLFARLSPFILVSFFILNSFFNQDFKGVIYLVGVIFACFVSIIIGNTGLISNFEEALGINAGGSEVCNLVTIGESATHVNGIPMGQTIISFTFFYLLTVILWNKVVAGNIPTIVFFPIIITFDFFWNLYNDCHGPLSSIAAIIIGGGIGALWAFVFLKNKFTSLLYFNSMGDKTVCDRPAKQLFKCQVYSNGKLLTSGLTG